MTFIRCPHCHGNMHFLHFLEDWYCSDCRTNDTEDASDIAESDYEITQAY
jgi:hypothetical protein